MEISTTQQKDKDAVEKVRKKQRGGEEAQRQINTAAEEQ